jgi:hypothetical protein
MNPDARGAAYMGKNLFKSRPGMRRIMKRLRADKRYRWHNAFEGSTLTATLRIKQDTERVYEALRGEVVAFRVAT